MQNSIDAKPINKLGRSYERTAWKWMRYSGILVIPLAFIHVLIQDVLVGVHQIDLNYVEVRWSYLGWRIYDAFLLVFAFTHGVNGLRQVLMDYIQRDSYRKWISRLLFIFWLLVSLAGAIALIAGVRS
jgi:succinate dehydrogenase / fumarate reductase membrane anchor subunit